MSIRHHNRCSGTQSPRDALHTIENRMVQIRKDLSRLKGDLGGGKASDAQQLAETIEHLARFGQVSSAAIAVEISSRIETLVSLLQNEIDGVIALQVT